MLNSQTLSTLIPAVVAGVIAGGSPNISIAEPITTISVLPKKDPCVCGSHGGGFEAIYNGKKISINFAYNPNPANPIEHPLIVIKNNKPFQGWDSLLCSLSNESCPVAGSKITVSGRWETKTSFEAYTISLRQ